LDVPEAKCPGIARGDQLLPVRSEDDEERSTVAFGIGFAALPRLDVPEFGTPGHGCVERMRLAGGHGLAVGCEGDVDHVPVRWSAKQGRVLAGCPVPQVSSARPRTGHAGKELSVWAE